MMEAWDAIQMTIMCQELHCLPGAGGLLDQDSKHVWLMTLVSNAQAERAKLEQNRAGFPQKQKGGD